MAVKVTGSRSGTDAVTVLVPGRPRVRVAAARPFSSVVAVVVESDPFAGRNREGDIGILERLVILVFYLNNQRLSQSGPGKPLLFVA